MLAPAAAPVVFGIVNRRSPSFGSREIRATVSCGSPGEKYRLPSLSKTGPVALKVSASTVQPSTNTGASATEISSVLASSEWKFLYAMRVGRIASSAGTERHPTGLQLVRAGGSKHLGTGKVTPPAPPMPPQLPPSPPEAPPALSVAPSHPGRATTETANPADVKPIRASERSVIGECNAFMTSLLLV